MNSKLVVIEGLDGSGKSTQFELVKKYLCEKGVDVKAISFPEYDKPSSALVKMYLGGEFSKNASDVNAYAASSFYAVDRYASYKLYWENDYLQGKSILAARYVTSNAIYQMTKLSKDKWNDYIDWLCEYEYEKLGLPKPDLVIFLDMPVEVSQKLMTKRYDGDEGKKDIHEANVEFLNNCREAALFAANKDNWKIISCSDGENPLPIDSIFNEIIKCIDNIM
ncbi:MAG: thymidylate kinase [Oscillospiraceae bacterium]|nr:thymidylate kinase [Oscillospiraceae bacterium]